MRKLIDFQRLKEEFDTEILGVYDRKLKGNYLIHQREPNKDGGIDYNTGGRELDRRGSQLIASAVNLFVNDFRDLARRFDAEYYEVMQSEDVKREQLSEGIGIINRFEMGVKVLSDERSLTRPNYYIEVYPAISHFPEQTPQEYKQGLGEMIFHQLRLTNMCGLGEADPFHFSGFDRILQLIPNKEFLNEDRIRQVGEGLVREVLRSMNGCRSVTEALDAIKRYDLQDYDLLDTVNEMEFEENAHKERMGRLRSKLKEEQEKYRVVRKDILSKIGEDMHSRDYGN
jgi:hypothetical protein